MIRDWMTVSSRSLMTPKVSVPAGTRIAALARASGCPSRGACSSSSASCQPSVDRKRRREIDPVAEEPFVVGDELAVDAPDAHLHARRRQRVAVDATVRVDQVAPERVRLGRGGDLPRLRRRGRARARATACRSRDMARSRYGRSSSPIPTDFPARSISARRSVANRAIRSRQLGAPSSDMPTERSTAARPGRARSCSRRRRTRSAASSGRRSCGGSCSPLSTEW